MLENELNSCDFNPSAVVVPNVFILLSIPDASTRLFAAAGSPDLAAASSPGFSVDSEVNTPLLAAFSPKPAAAEFIVEVDDSTDVDLLNAVPDVANISFNPVVDPDIESSNPLVLISPSPGTAS